MASESNIKCLFNRLLCARFGATVQNKTKQSPCSQRAHSLAEAQAQMKGPSTAVTREEGTGFPDTQAMEQSLS